MNTINGAKASTSRSDKSRTDEGGSGLATAMAVIVVAMIVVIGRPSRGPTRWPSREPAAQIGGVAVIVIARAGSRSGPKKTRSTSHSMYQAPSTTPKTASTAITFNCASSTAGERH